MLRFNLKVFVCNNSGEVQNWFNFENIQAAVTQCGVRCAHLKQDCEHRASTSIMYFFCLFDIFLPKSWQQMIIFCFFLDSSTLWTPALGLSGGLQTQPAHPVRSFWTQWRILLKISSLVAVKSLGAVFKLKIQIKSHWKEEKSSPIY